MIMEYLSEWLILISVFSIAVIAPGPDFFMVIRNSLMFSRRAGILTALGLGLGVTFHVSYTAIGIATLIASSVLLFTILKFAGAGYLIFIGCKALFSKQENPDNKDAQEYTIEEQPKKASKTMSDRQAIVSGFLTNVLNPKATMFFLALFSQIVSPEMPLPVFAFFGLTCVILVMSWFMCVAFILTNPSIKNAFLRFSKWIERITGGILIALGVKIALD